MKTRTVYVFDAHGHFLGVRKSTKLDATHHLILIGTTITAIVGTAAGLPLLSEALARIIGVR